VVIGGVLVVAAAMSTPQGKAATQQFVNATKQLFCPDDCAALQSQISALAGQLRVRYVQMTADVNNLFCTRPFGQFSWLGHVVMFNGKQRALQKLIAQAKAQGCPVNPDDERLANNTPPPTCPAR
jgi:hypothetical protein